MQIQLKTEGGLGYLPGLSKPIILDSSVLSAQEADKLKQLLNAVHFFNLPSVLNIPAAGAADYRRYTITVNDGGKQHMVQMADPIEDSNLQALLNFLQIHR